MLPIQMVQLNAIVSFFEVIIVFGLFGFDLVGSEDCNSFGRNLAFLVPSILVPVRLKERANCDMPGSPCVPASQGEVFVLSKPFK